MQISWGFEDAVKEAPCVKPFSHISRAQLAEVSKKEEIEKIVIDMVKKYCSPHEVKQMFGFQTPEQIFHSFQSHKIIPKKINSTTLPSFNATVKEYLKQFASQNRKKSFYELVFFLLEWTLLP